MKPPPLRPARRPGRHTDRAPAGTLEARLRARVDRARDWSRTNADPTGPYARALQWIGSVTVICCTAWGLLHLVTAL